MVAYFNILPLLALAAPSVIKYVAPKVASYAAEKVFHKPKQDDNVATSLDVGSLGVGKKRRSSAETLFTLLKAEKEMMK
jgi:hypothetical protein